MDYATLSILFLLIGLVILVGEFFIPSGGFLAILTIICFVISVWSAWKAWGNTSPVIWSIYLASIIVIIPAVLSGMIYLLPRTKFGRRVILDAPTSEDVVPYTEKQLQLEELIGKRGKTKTQMMPGGIVVIEGARIHAQSEGLSIDAEEEVVVIGIDGNRLVVRLYQETSSKEGEENNESSEQDLLANNPPEEPFDF
ncbi:hypothetical protein MNBD_PLANCTO02-2847 [hydrothermal vent metagenome]|uniref:NfeD-like C-terminal domain-containing protein n=1 Tax=hydrothermal vent metagenome TaxID=652676 RepID=A0A3B1DRD2_9ZZZZ